MEQELRCARVKLLVKLEFFLVTVVVVLVTGVKQSQLLVLVTIVTFQEVLYTKFI